MRRLILPIFVLAVAACGDDPAPPADTVNPGSDNFAQQPQAAPTGRFAPRNECIEMPGAKAFFVDLEKAVKDRDADALLALADPGVKLDFGGGGGLTTFRERLEDKEGTLWGELDAILALGCAVDEGGNLVLPWHFAQELGVDDPFSAMLATGTDVALREAGKTTARQVGSVSWDTVTLVDGYSDAAFLKVRTRDGKDGYIARDDLRSLLDYRLLVSSSGNDRWQITAFVAGD
jgi:hypothetical protein